MTIQTRLAAQLCREQTIRVVSYNVLSSHLSAPNYFQACKPENLSPDARLEKVRDKLRGEMERQSIICMQELSTSWSGKLHGYFYKNDYHFITALYGNKFNGYMGVGVAVPKSKYELLEVDITRVADTKRLPRAPLPGLFMSWLLFLKATLLACAKYLKLYQPPTDMWDNALYRSNQMICTRLKEKHTQKTFVVGNYHMPCMFKLPSVMVTHCALSAQHLQRWAKEDPYIYAGDFNIKPSSSQYQLMVTGTLEPNHPDYPTIVDDWRPNIKPLRSAYAVAKGREPDFTNYAKIQQEPTFIEVLDYLFLSDAWNVRDVLELPHRDTVSGPLPNDDEPSDHIMIAADLTLP